MLKPLQTCDENEGRRRGAKRSYTNQLVRLRARTPCWQATVWGMIPWFPSFPFPGLFLTLASVSKAAGLPQPRRDDWHTRKTARLEGGRAPGGPGPVGESESCYRNASGKVTAARVHHLLRDVAPIARVTIRQSSESGGTLHDGLLQLSTEERAFWVDRDDAALVTCLVLRE